MQWWVLKVSATCLQSGLAMGVTRDVSSRPPFNPIAMFRFLILQTWDNLGDAKIRLIFLERRCTAG